MCARAPAPSRRLTCALVLATHNDRRARRVLQTDRLLWCRDASMTQAERGAWVGGLEVHADTVHSCHEFTRPTPCAASSQRAHHSQRHAADALPVRSEALPRRGGGFTPGEHRASACERCRCRGSPAATRAALARPPHERRERQVDGDGGAERRRVWDGSPAPPCAVHLILLVPEQRRARVSDGRCGERSLGRARGGRRSRRTPSARCGALRAQRSRLCSAIVSTRQAAAPPWGPSRQPKRTDGPATGWSPLGTAGAPQQAGGGHGAAERPRNCWSSGWGREAWRTAIWGSVRRPSTRCARAGPSASASRPFWRISRGVGSDELRRRFESSWVALRSDGRDGDSGAAG